MSGDEQRDVPRIVRFGIFEADLAAGELRREGTILKLQDQPFRLLSLLLERPGAIITREELRAALWPDGSFVDFEYGVNTAIKKVRYALGDSADNPRFVQTLPRKGYRFIAPVTTEGPLRPPAAAPSVAASPKRRRTWMIAAVLAAALSASGLWVFSSESRVASGRLSGSAHSLPWLGMECGLLSRRPSGRVRVERSARGQLRHLPQGEGLGLPTRLTTDPAPDLSPAWSPDGRRIAFLRDLGKGRVAVMMVFAAGGPEVKIAETSAPLFPHYRNLAFSPDGNWLITAALDADAPRQHARTSGLFLYSVENGSRRRLTLPPAGYYSDTNPALAPDGRSLAFLRGPESLSAGSLRPAGRSDFVRVGRAPSPHFVEPLYSQSRVDRGRT